MTSSTANPWTAGMVEGRPLTGPRAVHFDIANGCNTRCVTCWHHSPHLAAEHVPTAAWKARELSFETWRRVFDQARALGGVEQIVLSGMGDPTLNDALYDMVAYAHRAGVGVTIITNLLRLDVDRVLASEGELNVLASICGVTESVWQDFHAHPTPSGFQRVLGRLEAMKNRGFEPKHVQVINSVNVHELPDMVRFARRYPTRRINFKLASLSRGTEATALSAATAERLVDEWIPRARGMATRYGIDTDLDDFAAQVTPGALSTAPIQETGCFMGYVYARVTVDLELLYCCNTAVSVGHLDDSVGFGALWYGPTHQGYRDQLRAGRYFAGCDQCGKFKQNAKWHRKLRSSLGDQGLARLMGPGEPMGRGEIL
ncbi:MAG: MoaA/NifB/PqqE/SkfB family radical SAM enzyme [Myxococcota bacterium]